MFRSKVKIKNAIRTASGHKKRLKTIRKFRVNSHAF